MPETDTPAKRREQLEALREIEEDLRRVAESDTPYAKDCQRLLDALDDLERQEGESP